MKPIAIPLGVSTLICSGMGSTVFALGLTFALWRPSEGIAYEINFHAFLLAACGLGLIMVGAALKTLWARVQKLEKQLALLKLEISEKL